jgi:hypothetical protein
MPERRAAGSHRYRAAGARESWPSASADCSFSTYLRQYAHTAWSACPYRRKRRRRNARALHLPFAPRHAIAAVAYLACGETGGQGGAHIPPDPATVANFVEAWHRTYRYARAGETAVIALMAAHHRLAWIHPFLDGNGRTARLHTHIGLSAPRLTQGLWSPMRGFAREHTAYYGHLATADARRKGDYDGRGVLSERGLVEFIAFAMNICLDQIRFMDGIL